MDDISLNALMDKIRQAMLEAKGLYEKGYKRYATERYVQVCSMMEHVPVGSVQRLLKSGLSTEIIQDLRLTKYQSVMHVLDQVRALGAGAINKSDLTGLPEQEAFLSSTPLPPSGMLMFCRNMHSKYDSKGRDLGKTAERKPAKKFFQGEPPFGLCEVCILAKEVKKFEEISKEKALQLCYVFDVMEA